eukprot:TRINITY_DN72642_c0_g1_i1.p1 TRINITY_DN72642_c0_g1~~TRINITY_DN72642_c0_g1_i1.p1  ORF type:complete len:1245 (-),score=276.03 TRINITY_DN72642_c0_g1_i1:210-3944(-)
MSQGYAQGTLIWIPDDEEVWKEAEIVSSDKKGGLTVKTEDVSSIYLKPGTEVYQRSSDVFTSEGLSVMDDLTQLAHLHEPAVLDSLQNRYDVDRIYTSTGPILIALNPFKVILGLYEDEVLRSHIREKLAQPHVFKTARASYRGICDSYKSQTVLISGESGAGKTETTKHVMRFLALAGSDGASTTSVEQQVLESNPLLEAFGNARTLRNDNSSRFGKFIELQFQVWGDRPRLCGARIQTYLLEKVRICDQQEGERNYHILYEACAAASSLGMFSGSTYKFPKVSDVRGQLDLNLAGFGDSQTFQYLTRSTCQTLKGVNDVERFEQRIRAMQTVGISAADIQSVLDTLAAVLHLGNVKFDVSVGDNGCEGSAVSKECQKSFDMTSTLLGVQRGDLETALCMYRLARGKEVISTPLNQRTAGENRDALARAIYGMVFDFIVKRTNASIGYKADVKLFVGVLDIFGFECFDTNSFEQLCINFTNERLQHFFIQYVFKYEEEIHQREGIPWDPLDFPDNQDSLELLQNPSSGIFTMLDEECVVPKGTDQGFCNKVLKSYKSHPCCDEILKKPAWFSIKHFAGPVGYCSDAFLEKNKDPLSGDVVNCLVGSSKPFIVDMFMKNPRFEEIIMKDSESDARKKKRKYNSVSAELRNQLTSLMDVVKATEPHFIRCIKPNAASLSDTYDRRSVTQQLRYSGVLQAVQVSRAGYPVRLTHRECWNDYSILASRDVLRELTKIRDVRKQAHGLIEHLDLQIGFPKPRADAMTWAVGNTMVFIRREAADLLKFTRLKLLGNGVILIQSCWRRLVCMRNYRRSLVALRNLQALLQIRLARQELRQRQLANASVAATKVQARMRGVLQRKKYMALLKSIAAMPDLLRPSFRGSTEEMKQSKRRRELVKGLVPVQTLQVSESSPVTCMCFGQQEARKAYLLLAVGCHDGGVIIYKCTRTAMEIEALAGYDFPGKAPANPPTGHVDITVLCKPSGHAGAISSICFNPREDRLFTTSLDKTLRFWDVETGKMVQEFSDCSPVRAALFLPTNPDMLVAANGKAVLRLVNQQTGDVVQKLKVRSEVRSLAFDGRGLSLLAGAKGGSVYVLEVADGGNALKFKYSVELDQGCVSCITFVRAMHGLPPTLLVSSSNNSAMVVDCIYGSDNLIYNLQVRSRMPVPNSVLPLRCCYSRGDRGFLVSGSEDNYVYVYSLAADAEDTARHLRKHRQPVVAVAVNVHDSVLASADKGGTLVLWRRMDL